MNFYFQASGCNGGHGAQSILSRHVFYENMTKHSDFSPSSSSASTEVTESSPGKRKRQGNRNFQPLNPHDMVYMNVIREPVG